MASGNNRPDILLAKYLTKTLTEEEKKLFDDWVNSDPGHKALVETLERNNMLGQQLEDIASVTDDSIEEDKRRLSLMLLGEVAATPAVVRPVRTRRIWWQVAAAASIVALSIVVYKQFDRPAAQPTNIVSTQAPMPEPGTDKAVLLLADGRKITLDSVSNTSLTLGQSVASVDPAKGVLTYQGGKSNSELIVDHHTLQTPTGGQYKVQLSDGTIVWLNAASSITYPTLFTGNTREISITGEVYLEVSKNKNKPFLVHVGKDQTIEVLGTRFAINAYPDEPTIKTTLVEGSVKVTEEHSNSSIRLKPGQQSQLSHESINVVNDVDLEEATAFVNGYFYFNNADVPTAMRQLAKWYGLKVSYKGAIKTSGFRGKIQRSFSLDDALKILGRYGVDFEVKGNEVVVQQSK
ncbi:MAG: hypothetical protein DI539_22000 [Flavobacterium psychrophilum]|nr:MAG: hypothetical protein DI539_22000 [Flavobacterium psychrophilum]